MEGFLRSEHQKPLQSNFPPLKSVLVIYDIICGNLFSFVTSTNKVATTFCHILWIYYEILTLKNLTSSHFLVKYFKSILLHFFYCFSLVINTKKKNPALSYSISRLYISNIKKPYFIFILTSVLNLFVTTNCFTMGGYNLQIQKRPEAMSRFQVE